MVRFTAKTSYQSEFFRNFTDPTKDETVRCVCSSSLISSPETASSGKVLLDVNFSPGPFDVICARGKDAWNHSGNKHLRKIATQGSIRYSQATNKMERTVIVSSIIEDVRALGHGFVKEIPEKGCSTSRWVQVEDSVVREKVGQLVRNALSNQYKSSTQSKKAKRAGAGKKLEMYGRNVLLSDNRVAGVVNSLTDNMDRDCLEDSEALKRFDEANKLMLGVFKNEPSLVARFVDAVNNEQETNE